jgi:Uma2 family endonuclease
MAPHILKGPFTVETYQRLGELGVLHEDDRVELIAGQVVQMSPIGPDHWSCVNRLNTLFAPLAGRAATVSIQNPLVLDEHHEPQPDVVLLRHRADGYRARPPRPADVLLVIEVADSSLRYDQEVKIPLYARAGIREVWLVDLTTHRIEIYGEPATGSYTHGRTLSRDAVLSPRHVPNFSLAVADILG